jgi:hypothetical protein
MPEIDPLDLPVHGAEAIASILNVRKKDGSLDLRRTFYLLQNGYVNRQVGPYFDVNPSPASRGRLRRRNKRPPVHVINGRSVLGQASRQSSE